MDLTTFVLANTRLVSPPAVPETRLHLADDVIDLWECTQEALDCLSLPPPFWAFAWAGGQALARYLLDHPVEVEGRDVLDLASGSGLVAIAAAMAGAAPVTASDVDLFAVAAIALNAEANGVAVAGTMEDVLDGDGGGVDVVLAGDVFYERSMADRVLGFLERARARGASVLVGDVGRAFLPRERFVAVATYEIPVARALEDADIKSSMVWRL